jgi:mono/diheme cytochrome c family protein
VSSYTKLGLILGAAVALAAAAGAVFIVSGVYNIGADDHHTKVVLAVIEKLRDRSIAVRADAIPAHDMEDPRRIAAGGRRYAELCVGCHLAPGVTKSDIRQGLYPHPPNLAQEEPQQAQRAFWIIKHGIKMSAMPAWSKTLDDEEIWNVVAFVRKMPDLTPGSYRQLSQEKVVANSVQ